MEDVPARQLFPGVHGVPADDARVLALRQLFLGRVRETLVHRVGQLPISAQKEKKTRGGKTTVSMNNIMAPRYPRAPIATADDEREREREIMAETSNNRNPHCCWLRLYFHIVSLHTSMFSQASASQFVISDLPPKMVPPSA